MSLLDKIKDLADESKRVAYPGLVWGGILVGLPILSVTVGAGVGAITGEILDHLPYLRHAIPEGIAYLGNAFTDQDTIQKAKQCLDGNLDKVGAAVGFIGGYLRSGISFHKPE